MGHDVLPLHMVCVHVLLHAVCREVGGLLFLLGNILHPHIHVCLYLHICVSEYVYMVKVAGS